MRHCATHQPAWQSGAPAGWVLLHQGPHPPQQDEHSGWRRGNCRSGYAHSARASLRSTEPPSPAARPSEAHQRGSEAASTASTAAAERAESRRDAARTRSLPLGAPKHYPQKRQDRGSQSQPHVTPPQHGRGRCPSPGTGGSPPRRGDRRGSFRHPGTQPPRRKRLCGRVLATAW